MQDISPRRPPVSPPARSATLQQSSRMSPPLNLPAERIQPPQIDLELPSPGKVALSPKKRRRWPWIVGLIVGLVIIFAACTFAAFAWYQDALQARTTNDAVVKIIVQPGATINQVGQELEQKSIIKNSLALMIYAKLHNAEAIKAGTYFFAPNQTVAEIVSWLQEGKIGTRKITIVPGKRLSQIRETLIADGFMAEDVDAAFAKTYYHPLLADRPAGASLEGYIFPETYLIEMDSGVEEFLLHSFDEFEKNIEASQIRQGLAAKGFTLHQGITLASIVAFEVSNIADQRQVAQVFELRYSLDMRLASDPTYKYAASLLGVSPSSSIDSPYNTYKYKGLPPGPIGNFNLSALQAVVSPAQGDYLYFVAGDDGTTHYAKTFEEHEQNIRDYCHKLCAQP